MPENFQAILEVAMKEAAFQMTAQSYHESAVNWASMKSEYPNIQVKNFPKEVIEAIKKANNELLGELEAKGGITAEIIQSQRDYLNKSRAWTDISDKAYLNNLWLIT